MRGKSWKKVADEQFDSLPNDFKDDWGELRDKVYRQ
jgi:hypothetical protein